MGMLDVLMDYDFIELLEKRMTADDLKSLEERINDPEQYEITPLGFLHAIYKGYTVEQLQWLCHWQRFAIDLAVDALTTLDDREAVSVALMYLLDGLCKSIKLLGK